MNIEKVFYRNKNIDFTKRILPILPAVDDDGVFKIFFKDDIKDEIIIIPGGRPVEANYLAKNPLDSKHINYPFIDLLIKKAYLPGIERQVNAVVNDIHNLSASIRKIEIYFLIYRYDKDVTATNRFVLTELEYIFSTCRSLFDIFQKVARKLWDNLTLDTKKGGFPESFADVVYKKGDELNSREELLNKYGMPELWADFYYKYSDIFSKIRNFRNIVLHKGFTPSHVYCTDKGFAVPFNDEYYSTFDAWKECTLLPNELAPLKPIVAKIILATLTAMIEFSQVFAKTIAMPDDVAPKYNIYIAGPHVEKLLELESYMNKKCWD